MDVDDVAGTKSQAWREDHGSSANCFALWKGRSIQYKEQTETILSLINLF